MTSPDPTPPECIFALAERANAAIARYHAYQRESFRQTGRIPLEESQRLMDDAWRLGVEIAQHPDAGALRVDGTRYVPRIN